ncbi:MAG: protein kinase, partial [Oscillospiraceae bacterium]|nr:protein kinase [Oscillospiraceae bacterium]
MSETFMISPLLDGMQPESQPPKGSGMFRVRHQASGRSLMVKRISIPESLAETQALVLMGAVTDNEHATEYYLSVADRYRKELKLFRELSKEPYICSYLRFQAVIKEDMPGVDLYLLAPCRTSLQDYLQHNAISQQKAVQLGLDLCNALTVLRKNGCVHQNLKPENIFLEDGRFCIGDFGLVQMEDIPYASLPAKMVGGFTPPELCSVIGTLNETIDLYAVGMMLYYIFNGNHAPFEEAGSTDRAADSRRIAGEDLPTPLYADYEMDAIIRKACAFKPEDRYQTPQEFLAALQEYRDRNTISDESIVPPIYTDVPEVLADTAEEEANFEPMPEDEPAEPVRFTDAETLSDDFKESFAPAQQDAAPPKKKKRRFLVPIILLVLALIAGGLAYFYLEYFAVEINSVAISEKGTDYITLSLASEDLDKLMITCTADDGSYTKTYYCEPSLSFFELQPGTAYTLYVDSIDWHHVKGQQEYKAATAALTEVLSLDAMHQDDGSVLVSFQVSGPEPEAWTLHCESELTGEVTYPVQDHTCIIPDMMPNCDYTLTLSAEEGSHLDGQLSIAFSYTLPITGSNLREESTGSDVIAVVWDSDSDRATQWKAVCSGDNGYAETIITDECRAEFADAPIGGIYTIAVSNATMTVPMLLTVESTVCDITSFTAEEADGKVTVTWEDEGNLAPEAWLLSYAPSGAAEFTEVEVSGNSTELSGLIPNAEYIFR